MNDVSTMDDVGIPQPVLLIKDSRMPDCEPQRLGGGDVDLPIFPNVRLRLGTDERHINSHTSLEEVISPD